MTVHDVQIPPIRPSGHETPLSVDAALARLRELGDRARVIAGGTDLIIELARRVGGPDPEGDIVEGPVLIDITRIPGLAEITERDGRIRLGPLVTHNQAATHPLVLRHGRALAQAAFEVGSPALRNRATVVGNVVTASPANDTISALRALDADLTLATVDGTRTLPLAEFHTGVRRSVIEADELVTGISFAVPDAERRSIFVKLGLRRAQAISVVHVALRCDLDGNGLVTDAAVALGSVAPTIVRAEAAERAIIGTRLDDNTIESAARAATEAVSPIDDLRAPATYREELIPVMVRRGLRALVAGEHERTPPDAPTLRGPSVPADGITTTTARADELECIVNGRMARGTWDGATLLDWVRDRAGLTGTKEGCAEGECGACTLHLDGVAVLGCLVPAARAQGARVVTIEGLADDTALHPIQQAFVDHAAVQCGYCIPGFLMAGAALLDERAEPTIDDLKIGLSGNLCRCTGYYTIEAAFGPSDTTEGTR